MNDDICKLHLKTLTVPQISCKHSLLHQPCMIQIVIIRCSSRFKLSLQRLSTLIIYHFLNHTYDLAANAPNIKFILPQQKPPLLNKKWSSKFEILTTNKLQLWSKKGMIEKNRPTFKRCGGEIQLKSQSGMWRSVFLSKSLLWLLVLVQSLNEQADAARQHLHIENKNCTCNRLHSS